MTLKEIADVVLQESPDVGDMDNWMNIDAYNQLMEKVYSPDVWNKNFRDNIRNILKKDIGNLNMDEVKTFLTFIYCHDRTCEGFIESHIKNGTIHKLMQRIIELEGSDTL